MQGAETGTEFPHNSPEAHDLDPPRAGALQKMTILKKVPMVGRHDRGFCLRRRNEID